MAGKRIAAAGRLLARVLARAFSLASLGLFSFAAASLVALERGSFAEGGLRSAVETTIRERFDGARVERAALHLTRRGRATLVLSELAVPEANATLNHVAVALRPSGLLQGRAHAERLHVVGGTVRPDAVWSAGAFDPAQAVRTFSLDASLRQVAAPLRAAKAAMDRAALDTVVVRDVDLSLPLEGGLAVRVAYAVIERNHNYHNGLDVHVRAIVEGRSMVLRGRWDETADGEFLSVSLAHVPLRWLPTLFTRGTTPVRFDAPASVRLRLPFAADGRPKQARVEVEVAAGHVWFGSTEPTPLLGAKAAFRLNPAKNAIALLPSTFQTTSVSGTVVGGVRKGDGAVLDFEFATEELASRAAGAARPVAAAWHVSGEFDVASRRLDLDDVRLVGEGGGFAGSGALDLNDPWPGMRVTVRTAGLNLSLLKAHWPPFVAAPVRDLVHERVRSGRLGSSVLDLDVPPGLLGRLHDGVALGPDQLNATVAFDGARLRTAGDLPDLEGAAGTLRVSGATVLAELTAGAASPAGGHAVAFDGSRMVVPDAFAPGLPVELDVTARGPASDLLRLSATKPLRLPPLDGIGPTDVHGTVALAAKASLPLRGAHPRPTAWSAEAKVEGLALARPFRGRRVADADLVLRADGEAVRVDGTARLDGVKARLAFVQPLGTGGTAGDQRVALRLGEKDRARLGLALGGLVRGPVDVRLRSLPGGGQRADVDLSGAIVDLAFLDWRKGAGVPARLQFDLEQRDGQTRIGALQLTGSGISARGRALFDRKGMRSAAFEDVRLGTTDALRLSAKRGDVGYKVVVSADRFDARSVLALLTKEKGTKGAGGGGGSRINVVGDFKELVGFNGQTVRGASVQVAVRGSEVRAVRFTGVAGTNGATAITLARKGNASTLRAESGDAGALLAFSGLYDKMRGGTLGVQLRRTGDGPYRGTVAAKRFDIVGEPKLQRLFAKGRTGGERTGSEQNRPAKRRLRAPVRIEEASAAVRKSGNALVVANGRFRGGDMAMTFEGTVFDANDRMKLKGTFLPAYGLNRLVSNIPFVGLATGNGRKSGLVGITFRLSGPWRAPALQVNPISLFAPGVFRKVFE